MKKRKSFFNFVFIVSLLGATMQPQLHAIIIRLAVPIPYETNLVDSFSQHFPNKVEQSEVVVMDTRR